MPQSTDPAYRRLKGYTHMNPRDFLVRCGYCGAVIGHEGGAEPCEHTLQVELGIDDPEDYTFDAVRHIDEATGRFDLDEDKLDPAARAWLAEHEWVPLPFGAAVSGATGGSWSAICAFPVEALQHPDGPQAAVRDRWQSHHPHADLSPEAGIWNPWCERGNEAPPWW